MICSSNYLYKITPSPSMLFYFLVNDIKGSGQGKMAKRLWHGKMLVKNSYYVSGVLRVRVTICQPNDKSNKFLFLLKFQVDII